MRINVYSQELTSEVKMLSRAGEASGEPRVYYAAQLMLHSSLRLHHPPQEDDRSAITFWLPKSRERREEVATAFERLAEIFRTAPLETAGEKSP